MAFTKLLILCDNSSLKCTIVIFVDWENVWKDILTRSGLTMSKWKLIQWKSSHTVIVLWNIWTPNKPLALHINKCFWLPHSTSSCTKTEPAMWLFLGLWYLADPGKARGCSTNTFAIYSLNNWFNKSSFSWNIFTVPSLPNKTNYIDTFQKF